MLTARQCTIEDDTIAATGAVLFARDASRDASMHSVNRCLRERGYDVIGWQSASIASASFTSRAVTPPASWLQSDNVTSA